MAGAAATGKQGGKSGTIATLAILTVLAGGGGALVGKLVGARLRAPPSAPATAVASPSPYVGTTEVRELQPIVTDLVGTPPTRVRLQAAIVYAKAGVDNPALLTAQVSDDILAFLKTLSLAQLEGASGLQNLREDLNERAVVRSQGHVREVIIETLVTQ